MTPQLLQGLISLHLLTSELVQLPSAGAFITFGCEIQAMLGQIPLFCVAVLSLRSAPGKSREESSRLNLFSLTAAAFLSDNFTARCKNVL